MKSLILILKKLRNRGKCHIIPDKPLPCIRKWRKMGCWNCPRHKAIYGGNN